MEGTPPVAPPAAESSPQPLKPIEAQPASSPGDARAELARKALVPLVPNAGPRCPRCGVRLLADSKSCPRCKVDPASAEAAAMLVPVGTPWREVFRGALYVPRGFVTILARPRLWPAAALPLLLNIALFAVVWWFGMWVIEKTLQPLTSTEALPDWNGFFWTCAAYVVKFIAWIATATLTRWLFLPLVVAWAMTAPPFSFVLRALFAPLSTIVGERTEQLVLGLDQAKLPFNFGEFQASITLSIINSVLLLFVQCLLYIVLVPLALIPPVWMLLPPAIMAGMDHSDPTFCRKSYYMRERIALWRARKWRFLGFGVTFFFLLTIPFLNAFIFPTVAVGAALLYLELDRK